MRTVWTLALLALSCILAPPWPVESLAAPRGPVLLAELPDSFSMTINFPAGQVPSYARFGLGYPVVDEVPELSRHAFIIGPADDPNSTTNDNPNDTKNQFHAGPSNVCTYFDFTSNDPSDFDSLVEILTNGQNDDIYWGIAFYTADGSIIDVNYAIATGPASLAFGTSPDLAGQTINFVRLVVNDVTFSIDEFGGTVTWDYHVVWQFWSGSPDAVAGRGQRADVNDFLKFLNPLETRISLPISVSSYPIAVKYGPTIYTFQAVLNGLDITGFFHPGEVESETVAIPIYPGRNILKFKVDGTVGGRIATDRDTLTIICPY